MKTAPDLEKYSRCLNCRQELTGKFCSNCGEKIIQPKHDYSLSEFIEQAVHGFTHLDSTFIRTFKNLLFRPGVLTKEYISGRRVKLMKPIQIFIIASILFYFFMPRTYSFYESFFELQDGYAAKHFSIGNPFKYDVSKKLKTLALQQTGSTVSDSLLKKTESDIYLKIDEKAAAMSKTWLFIIVPVWGLLLYLLFYKQNHFYVPHLVFVIHIFSFFLIADLFCLFLLFDVLKFQLIKTTVHLLPFLLLMWIYIIIAVKRFYLQSTGNSIWKGTVSFVALLILLAIYRVLITSWAFYFS